MNEISEILKTLLLSTNVEGVSDLHLVPDTKARIRKDGVLMQVGESISADSLKIALFDLLNDNQKLEFERCKDLDFALQLDIFGRFRFNLYHINGGKIAASIRKIPSQIPSLDELGALPILKELVSRQKGLILVTGSTGSGKSTLLAAMLNEINLTEQKHIITIEDPVEFVHENKKSLFSHRNLNSDTKSYENAIKYALRQDPDVILIGEMRDVPTMRTAISAAETGHLVFSTLHTNSAIESINRIIDSFDGVEQNQIRNMLSTSLTAIVSQSLVPKVDGGRIGVCELLVNNYAIGNLIRENKIHQILSQMQLNQNQTGMVTQSQALVKLLDRGVVDKKEAIKFSNNQQEFLNLIGM